MSERRDDIPTTPTPDVRNDGERSYLDDLINDETSRIEQGFAETEKSAAERFDVSEAGASALNDRLDAHEVDGAEVPGEDGGTSKLGLLGRATRIINKANELVDLDEDADDLGDEAIPDEDLARRGARRALRNLRSRHDKARAAKDAAKAAEETTQAATGASEVSVGTNAAASNAALHLGAEAEGAAAVKGASHLRNFFQTIRARRAVVDAATRATRFAAAKRVAAAAAGKVVAGLAVPALGIVLAFVFMIVSMSMCMGVVAPLLDETTSSEANLKGNEKIVAEYLLDKDLDQVHVAAILANMRAESGGERGTDFNTGSIEVGSGAGHGLCQWTGVRWDGYDDNGNKVTSSNLLDFATSHDKEWTDLGAQLDFFWEEYSGNWSGNYSISMGSTAWGDPLPGQRVSGSKQGFLDTSDVEEATMQFCYGWERPGIPHAATRKDNAQWYLDALQGGGGHGQDYQASSDDQRAVVDASFRTPAAEGGLCATWVSKVYQNAVGWSWFGGDACDMYWNYCTSDDRGDLEVGMIIATPHSEPPPKDGWKWGHVGIYIGDNQVRHSIGYVTTDDLDTWINNYAYNCTAKWGYPPH